jgi:hypothetical protein
MDKGEFNNCLSKLVNEDFSFDPNLGSWERMRKIRIERINIGYNEYPGSYYPKGMGAYIKFNDVEDILNKVLDKYKIQQRYGNETIRSVLFNLEGVDYGKFKTKIHDDESFQVVAEEIKKIVKYGAMPFFERFQTLENVADLLADKTPEEVVPYIQGSILLPKTILILKIAKHKRFEEKLIEFREVLKQYTEKKEIYKQMLILYDNLFADDLKRL